MDELASDLLASVFSHLPPDEVPPLARVQRSWNTATDDRELWRILATRTFGLQACDEFSGTSCKRLFQRVAWIRNNWMASAPRTTIETLEPHDGPRGWLITALAENGGIIAAGGTDGTIRLWRTATRKFLGTLVGHTSTVSALLVSADGRRIYSGSWDKALRTWDVATQECTQHMAVAHRRAVMCLHLQEEALISGGGDGRVAFWDLELGLSCYSKREDWPVGQTHLSRLLSFRRQYPSRATLAGTL